MDLLSEPSINSLNVLFSSSVGKFGGLQNKAPPLDRLNGAVFSCPLPPVHKTICAQIGMLAVTFYWYIIVIIFIVVF